MLCANGLLIVRERYSGCEKAQESNISRDPIHSSLIAGLSDQTNMSGKTKRFLVDSHNTDRERGGGGKGAYRATDRRMVLHVSLPPSHACSVSLLYIAAVSVRLLHAIIPKKKKKTSTAQHSTARFA